jgi:hypothetical protein
VKGDGRELLKTGVLTGRSALAPVNVGLRRVRTLELISTDAGNGKAFDHSVWFEPRLWTEGRPEFATRPAPAMGPWRSLFNREDLAGWQPVSGGPRVEARFIILENSAPRTGVKWTGPFPKNNYEVEVIATPLGETIDDFCGFIFPVGGVACNFVAGGRRNTVVGLRMIDGKDANANITTRTMRFERGRWYRKRVRVTTDRVEAWIDGRKVADVPRKQHTFTPVHYARTYLPFGFYALGGRTAVRSVRLRQATDAR